MGRGLAALQAGESVTWAWPPPNPPLVGYLRYAGKALACLSPCAGGSGCPLPAPRRLSPISHQLLSSCPDEKGLGQRAFLEAPNPPSLGFLFLFLPL